MVVDEYKHKFHFLWPAIILLILVVLNISLFYLARGSNLEKTIEFIMTLNPTTIKNYVYAFGPLAPLMLISLLVLQALVAPIPGHFIIMSAGLLYGAFWGSLLVIFAGIISAALCFKISEHFGRPLVEKFIPKKDIDAVDKFMGGRKGYLALIFIRLNPILAADVVSYAAGLTKMDFKTYMIASTIGIIPSSFIYTAIGNELVSGNVMPIFILSLILIALIIVVPIVYNRMKD